MAHGDIEKLRASLFRTSEYRAGDEVMFTFEGVLVGTVRRVRFEGRKVRYEVTLAVECEVPEACVVGPFDGGAE